VKSISTTNISNWNTAFGWGNHASAGYLVPIVTSPVEGQVLKYISGAWRNSSASSSPDSTTAHNGLTLVGKDVELGGDLLFPTAVGGAFSFTFQNKTFIAVPTDTVFFQPSGALDNYVRLSAAGGTEISSGDFTHIYGGLTVSGRVNISGASAPVTMPNLSSDPVSGSNGDIYYNTASNKFRKYENFAWKDLVIIGDAVADGVTKGQATFNANDFNSSGGAISLDYNNMQVGSGSQNGIITPALFNTFSQNLSTAGLTAAGDYLHDWDHRQFFIDNIQPLRMQGEELDGGRLNRTRFLMEPGTFSNSTPILLESALIAVDGTTDSITNAFETANRRTRMVTLQNQAGGVFSGSVQTLYSPTPAVLLSATKGAIESHINIYGDTALISSAGIRLYNTSEDIKLSTGPGVTPYATWKNGGRLLIGTTTDNGSSKLQINASLADFQSAVKIDVTGNATFQNPIGLTINDASTDGGYLIQGSSTNGYGIATQGIFGIAGTATAIAEGRLDGAGVVGGTFGNTTAPALKGVAYGTLGAPNQILSGLDLWRTPLSFPTSGGIMMRTFLPVYINAISAVAGTPILANTITSATSNYVGVNYTTDLSFSGVKDSVYATYMTIKGGGQIRLHKYGINTFTGTAAYMLGVDASGNVVETAGGGGGGEDLEATLNLGSTLATSHTVVVGTNTLLFSNTRNTTSGLQFNNSNNGTAADFTANGSGVAITVNNSGSGNGMQITNGSGFGAVITSTSGTALSLSTSPTSTNTVVSLLRTQRGSSATPTAGIGGSWDMQLAQANGNLISSFSARSVLTDVTNGSIDADYQIHTAANSSLTQVATYKSTGQVQYNLYGSGTYTGTVAYGLGVTSAGNLVEYTPAAAVSGANPSASVGLTAVNGAASTYMRSDGAPALSQSIAPVWTGAHTFTATGSGTVPGLGLKNTSPYIDIWNTAVASSDQHRWGLTVGSSGGPFQLRTVDDDGSVSSGGIALQAFRNGGTVQDVHLLVVSGTTQLKIEPTQITMNSLVGTGTRTVTATSAGVLGAGPILASGSWSPTLTGVANVDGTPTSLHATYTRVGSIVRCQVTLSIDPTVITTQTEVGISLPIASAFTGSNDASGEGAGSTGNGVGQYVQVVSDATNDRATLIFQSGSTSASIITATFQYTIL
jgi:hypothetical protein